MGTAGIVNLGATSAKLTIPPGGLRGVLTMPAQGQGEFDIVDGTEGPAAENVNKV